MSRKKRAGGGTDMEKGKAHPELGAENWRMEEVQEA